MPAGPLGLGGLLSQAAAGIHYALHPLSMLVHRFLGVRAPGDLEDLDLAAWALLSWLLGSRESEAARKLGLVVAAALLAAALLEALQMG